MLDVCCGSGASALPAAAAVGPGGRVIGVDAAAELLARGKAKARVSCLTNVDFESGDLLDLRYPDESFDLVVCVFGIFFVPDMAQGVRELWRRVRPGGPGWARVSEAAGFGRESIPGGPLAWTNWIAGVVAVYGSLFGIGKLVFGEWASGITMLAVAALAFAWIARSFREEGWA